MSFRKVTDTLLMMREILFFIQACLNDSHTVTWSTDLLTDGAVFMGSQQREHREVMQGDTLLY